MGRGRMKYESRQEVANKADWEGGLLEFVFGYGVDPDEMPDAELSDAVRDLLAMEPLIDRVKQLLPEPGEEDE